MKTVDELFPNLIGQSQAKLAITDWYNFESQPLLLYGASGYGKTAYAESLGARTIDTTQFKGDRINSILKPIKESEDGEILFFDEIHSLPGKVLEGLYKVIDKGTFYDTELGIDLPLPKVKYIFATNILNPLPEAFKNRCKFVELQKYSESELMEIVHKVNPLLNKSALKPIVRASKGVPRTALSLAKSMQSGAITEKYDSLDAKRVNKLLESRFNINGETGLSKKEFTIIQRVIQRGRLSTTAVANILGCTVQDAKLLYIEPLRASNWLAVSSQGVIPGMKAHENYRIFMTRTV